MIYTKNKKNSDKIHVAYTGIIDSKEKGALIAARSAAYLNDDYVIHIAGRGKKADVDELVECIKNNKSGCKVVFEGYFDRKGLEEFLSGMDVGLSTRPNAGEYLKYSFPSKVLTYLGMGLRVVSSNIDCVKNSRIAHLINFYEKDNPKSLAECIKNIDFNVPFDSRRELKRLENELVISVKNLLDSN